MHMLATNSTRGPGSAPERELIRDDRRTAPGAWSTSCGIWARSPGSRSPDRGRRGGGPAARRPRAGAAGAVDSPAEPSPPSGSATAAGPTRQYAPDRPARGLVRAAGGVPVLAHPRSPGYEIPNEVYRERRPRALAGIEVYHPDHDEAQREPLLGLAGSLDLIRTGGSDDHG